MFTAETMIVTVFKALHSKNGDKMAPSKEVCEVEIAWFRPRGIVTPSRLPQEANAPGPRVVTVTGMSNFLSFLHPLNA
jgi:hypothetical protein